MALVRCVVAESLRVGPSSHHAPLAETFEARPNRLVFPGSNSCQWKGPLSIIFLISKLIIYNLQVSFGA